MRVERFAYDLPPELIAQEATADREAARLMIVAAEVEHGNVGQLAERIPPGSLVVVNDTRVIRARIRGTKDGSGGKAEIFLVRREPGASDAPALGPNANMQRWRAMARASKPLRAGARVLCGGSPHALVVEIEGKADDGLFVVRLESRDPAVDLEAVLQTAADIPLPPYIKRAARPDDEARYQTVFARVPGAIAAPTAGLHLTEALLARLEAKSCEIASCTLHVGLGTFEAVKTDDLDDHVMHAEHFEVSHELAVAIARARARGAPVVAVGTTVVRALESAADPDRLGHVRPCAEETRLLIQPGSFGFRVVDRLLTNFHLPRSTLLALVCAFAGTERVLDAYRTAVALGYRFFSYGDAMLLTRERGQDAVAAEELNA